MADRDTRLLKKLPGMAYRCRNDRQRTMEFVSEGSAELTGYLPADLVINHRVAFGQLIHPDDQEFVWKSIQGRLEDRVPFRLAYRIVTAVGEEKWVWEQGAGIPGPEGSIVAVKGFITDINDRLAAYQALEKSVERRTQELSTLLDVSHSVTSTLELQPLLGLILEKLQSVMDYTGATVFTLTNEELAVMAYRGPAPQADMLQLRFRLGEALAHREVIVGRTPCVITDIRSDEPLARAFQDSAGKQLETTFGYVRSWMGVPLIAKEHTIGMLSLYHGEPNFYSSRDARLALAFGNEAATAIENARLYTEARQRASEIATLYNVQQAITSHLDLDAVLKLIADEARRLTSTRRSAVLLKDGDDLAVSALSGEHRPGVSIGYRIPISTAVGAASFREGRPVVISDAESDRSAGADELKRLGMRSFMSVPLISGDQRIGVISVTDKTRGELISDDERVLAMLASGAVVALENARLYEGEQERRREAEQRRMVAEGLRDILAIINTNRPLGEILDFVVAQAGHLLDTDLVALYRQDEDAEQAVIHATPTVSTEKGLLAEIPLGPKVAFGSRLTRKPVTVSDTTANSRRGQPSPELDARCRALLAVPLTIQGRTRGGLEFYYPQPREFSEEEVRLAVTFADHAALAIENSRLRTQAEQAAVTAERSRLARDLHDAVTQTLFSASLIAEVLPRLWRRNAEEGQRRLEELRQLTRGALAEMRTLLLELRPTALTEADLGDLLRQLTEAMIGRGRVPISLTIEGERALPPDVQVALYRIAQEALNNVAKHSRATQASVLVRCRPGGVEMEIDDNGRGFEPESVSAEHLGLGILRERAESVGATISIRSAPGHGTQISVKWTDEGECEGDE